MPNQKPTIAVIPGAWLPLGAYDDYLSALKEAGYPGLGIGYPSLDPEDPSTTDIAKDTTAIREALVPLLDEGKYVVLVLHSYGSMPGAAAAKGLSTTERLDAGLPGGIVGLIYVSAFVVSEGVSCVGMTGGGLAPWILRDTPKAGLTLPENPARMFGSDYPPGEAESRGAACRPHASLAFETPQLPPAAEDDAFTGKMGYIVTTQDDEVPKEAQYAMIGGLKKDWVVREIAGSHMSPFGGRRLADSIQALTQLIESFEKV
ncbi:hypothetical protein JX265_004559 [Neoarthrinium moseri]|uniref:AB hydrolase-1 domain-containing protein n=1 Tax=Neoarthrinium moseri TaxID=1658444 RepID=A0A9P9WRC7_9PEZI|nr:hypothetical protein JX266_003692 [Neoarthrinium moseri]KAI1875501.1 hypothetical protein JX265_004559 [Neoarthrinium moseri]